MTIPAQTHTVLNQSVPAAGRNAYTLDTVLLWGCACVNSANGALSHRSFRVLG